ncbi:3-methyladenine DNA glycosylase [Fusarium falciforme]|nr:3-methyladenine DNA glycosylase [Fusarium falciforme]KAJ4261101.1 3-methyladenine DNA glycosylase [Fusarium falciforme]
MHVAHLRHHLTFFIRRFTIPSRTTQVTTTLTTSRTMAATRRSARISAQSTPKLESPTQTAPKTNGRKRKAPPAKDGAEAPSTPPRKRAQGNPTTPAAALPPLTPTPTAAGLFAESGNSTRKPRSATVTRLANPKLTNAPLLSPETSRLVASRDIETVSPTKAPQVRTTTENLLQEACDYLVKVDGRMKPLIENHHCRVFSPEGLAEEIDPFESLSSGIISQQVSGAAAKSIKAKFIALFEEQPDSRFPHPSQVAAKSIEELRTAGLSQRKAEYIKGLAEKFASGELSARMLHDASDEEVMEKLIAVRGLGKWSVEMFACFGLKRMDVFSLGDLGVQRGMAAFVGRDVAKLKSKGGKWKYMSEQDMIELSDKFAPYRSLFMWYMWRVEETDISTME